MPRVDGEYFAPHLDVISNTTIESDVHNDTVHDLVLDANFPRPVIAGGTGGINPTEARANLSVEVRGVAIANYDSHAFEVGSFFSAAAVTAAPNATDPFVGICLRNSVSDDLWLSAVSQTTGAVYNRRRASGIWNAWTVSFLTPTEAASKAYVGAYIGAAAGIYPSGIQVNGGMTVSQERTIGTTVTTATSSHICDGWQAAVLSSQAARIVVGTQGMNWLQYEPTTPQPTLGTSDFASFYSKIEAQRMLSLGWGTSDAIPLTVVFWSRHDVPGLYPIALMNHAAGGSDFDTRSCVQTYTHAVGGVAQQNVITFPGDTVAKWKTGSDADRFTWSLTVVLGIAAHSAYEAPALGTWFGGADKNYRSAAGVVQGVATTGQTRFTGVLLLPGAQTLAANSVPYLLPPYDQELTLCRRYYQTLRVNGITGGYFASGQANTTTSALFPIRITPPMRVTPIVSLLAPDNYHVGRSGAVSIAATAIAASNATIDMYDLAVTTSGLTAGQSVLLMASPATFTSMVNLDARM